MEKRILYLLILLFSIYLVNTNNLFAKNEIERGGDILQIFIPSSAFAYSLITKDSTGSNQFIKSFMFNIAVTYILKISINKKRPDGGSYSFPSGHTSTSFQGAAYIQKRYGWKYGFYAYLGAGFVGCSRIIAEKHYTEDVLAGAVLGIVSSYLFTENYKKIVIAPCFQKNCYSINVRWEL